MLESYHHWSGAPSERQDFRAQQKPFKRL
jgi:hypothetical protein